MVMFNLIVLGQMMLRLSVMLRAEMAILKWQLHITIINQLAVVSYISILSVRSLEDLKDILYLAIDLISE